MHYNQRKKAIILLEDGTIFHGKSIGKEGSAFGEVCFNTGMTGYQEIFTDPSYFGQLMVTTNAYIGNYGVKEDEVESDSVKIAGLICRNFTYNFSRYGDVDSLYNFFEKNNLLVKAINKNVRTSPRKLALVCNFIKGKKADIALRDLEFTRKKIAKEVSKTVKSAISNAENNHQYDIDNLFVKEAYVGKSLVMKRYRPRAKGRASPIKKPFSRITIILEEKKIKKVNK